MPPQMAEVSANTRSAATHRTSGLDLRATTQVPGSRVKLVMMRLLQRLRDPRTLGPLSVMAIVVIYFIFNQFLPAPIHNYIYSIGH
jgi:hypothetical protein